MSVFCTTDPLAVPQQFNYSSAHLHSLRAFQLWHDARVPECPPQLKPIFSPSGVRVIDIAHRSADFFGSETLRSTCVFLRRRVAAFRRQGFDIFQEQDPIGRKQQTAGTWTVISNHILAWVVHIQRKLLGWRVSTPNPRQLKRPFLRAGTQPHIELQHHERNK